jgi:hypothetical protein
VLSAPDQFGPAPPPASDSAEDQADLDELTSFQRTVDSNTKALYAQSPDGIFTSWYTLASQRIFEHHLDTNAPRAARIYALLGVVHHDA